MSLADKRIAALWIIGKNTNYLLCLLKLKAFIEPKFIYVYLIIDRL